MKRSTLLILLIAALIALCACKTEAPQLNTGGDPADKPSQTVTSTDADTGSEDIEASPMLQTEIADGTNENRFECIHHWGDYGYEMNLIWCEKTIYNVALILIESEDALTWTTDGTAVYELEEMLPTAAIKLDMLVPEGFSTHAIVYTVDGNTYRYAIGYNGRDGGISFSEIDVVLKEKQEETAAGFIASIFTVNETENGELYQKKESCEVESESAWHVWAELKRRNTLIPTGAYLNSFKKESGAGYLDIGEGIYAANVGGAYEAEMLKSIANTFIDTYGIEKLYITVDGNTYESGHLVIDEPFTFSE